jgi:phage internal scaffolding protein
MKFRKHFDYDVTAASDEAVVKVIGESLTVQSQAEDADINVLMKRFGITGKFPENVRVPTYGDFTGVSDFRSALDAIRLAQDGFMELPAELRARFENDPQKLLEFCADGRNMDEARKLGLLKEKVNGDRSGVAGADKASGAHAAAAGGVVSRDAQPGGGGAAAGGAAGGNAAGAAGGGA